jgi:transcription antitermination factor NusG
MEMLNQLSIDEKCGAGSLTSEGLSAYNLPNWYAIYTLANHEKRVAEQLAEREFENFLPIYEAVRRWKDRRVQLQLPLFPGYVFVRLALRERLRVLQLPSVVQLVSFGGLPRPLPETEIENIRSLLTLKRRVEPHPYLRAGRRVRIKTGSLAGREGILVRRKGSFRVVLSIELLMRSIIVDMDVTDLDLPKLQ